MKRIVDIAIVTIISIGLIIGLLMLSSRTTISPVAIKQPGRTQEQTDTLQSDLLLIHGKRLSGIESAIADVNGVVSRYGTYLERHCKRITVLENAPTIETVAPKVIPGVVHIMCSQWQGSGFVVGPRLIATARHVVEGVTDFVIMTNSGHKLKATRAISFKNRDVGFIWVDDLRCVSEVEREFECSKVKHEVRLQVLELGSIKECSLGQPVFAIGSPFGKINFNHLSSGIISTLDRSWNELGENYGWEIGWTTTVAAHPGNSGCPIFTLDGKVRGILVGGFSPVLILAMPVDLFTAHMDEIVMMFEMDRFKKEQKVETAPVQYTSKGEIE